MSEPEVKKRKSADGEKKKKKKKVKVSGPPTGVPLFFGSTTWDGSPDSKESNMVITPSKIPAMAGRKVSKVVMGPAALHGLIFTKQGSVFAFGRNDQGQLGQGDLKDRSGPRKVEVGGKKIIDGACGKRHTLLLADDGTVHAMGDNRSGQLGLGNAKVTNRTTATCINTDHLGPIKKVACGGEFSMILTQDGRLYAFGHPDKGCLGNGTNGEYFVSASKLSYHFEYAPIPVVEFVDKDPDRVSELQQGREVLTSRAVGEVVIDDVACGPQHTAVITTDGSVYTWGFGGYGRLGHNSVEDEMRPRLLQHFISDNPLTNGGARIFCGGTCTFATTRMNGDLWFWGQTNRNADAAMYPKPVPETQGMKLGCFSTGQKHVFLDVNDAAYAYGTSPCFGELGFGEESQGRSSSKPLTIGPLQGLKILDVACGVYQTLVVVANDKKEYRSIISDLPTFGKPWSACHKCKTEEGEDMLLCDMCDRPTCFKCTGLTGMPKDDEEWFCHICK